MVYGKEIRISYAETKSRATVGMEGTEERRVWDEKRAKEKAGRADAEGVEVGGKRKGIESGGQSGKKARVDGGGEVEEEEDEKEDEMEVEQEEATNTLTLDNLPTSLTSVTLHTLFSQ